MVTKIDVLKSIKIGERVAEEESDQLEKYFVETDQWQQMRTGEIDVVYGPKGSGKSALYTLLNKKENELFDDGVLISPAENIRGATVFRAIISDPPPSELSFIYLWKLYGLILIAKTLREYDVKSARPLVSVLEEAGLLPTSNTLSALFRAATNYLKQWINRDKEAIEHAISLDPSTGMPSISRRVEYREMSEAQVLNDLPVEEYLEIANQCLEKASLKVWILFDRLDVAFAESSILERNALRALFRAYNDLKAYRSIALKIFVRDDIWNRITAGGFTEASHITKSVHISWNEEGLLNLVVRRLINNPAFVGYVNINPESIKTDYAAQRELFYRLVPDQVDTGKNPQTFNWIISRTTDASGKSVPREIIHLIEAAKDIQVQKIERGSESLENEQLFERSVFKEALPVVSKVRYEQTLLAEHPDVRDYLKLLEGEKAEQSIGSLSQIWKISSGQAEAVCRRLCEIGFFELRGTKEEPSYWVPFVYRSALSLIQGRVEDLIF